MNLPCNRQGKFNVTRISINPNIILIFCKYLYKNKVKSQKVVNAIFLNESSNFQGSSPPFLLGTFMFFYLQLIVFSAEINGIVGHQCTTKKQYFPGHRGKYCYFFHDPGQESMF